MAENTKIPWCDHTFNIAWGCWKISDGCANCYADVWDSRFGGDHWGPHSPRRTFGAAHWAEPLKWNRLAEFAERRRRVFCSSMTDVFLDDATISGELLKLWPLIRETPWLDWQLLTKRPERIAESLPSDWGDGYPNVWLGVSVENQEYAKKRLTVLREIPAAIRWVSYEPALGPVDFTPYLDFLDWVIIGGESGSGSRPFNLAWALSTVDRCRNAGIAPYVKQLGANAVRSYMDGPTRRLHLNDPKGGDPSEWPESLRVREFPKARA